MTGPPDAWAPGGPWPPGPSAPPGPGTGWGPPGIPPSWAAPPPWGAPAPPPGPPARGRTNGLAIAALVLSVLWLGGLGSLAAVVLGVLALRAVRRDRSQGGYGLAVAGIVVGSVGVLMSVLVAVVAVQIAPTVRKAYDQATRPTVVPLGRTVDLSDLVFSSGLARATVADFRAVPAAGRATAQARICAGGDGGTELGSPGLPDPFTLRLADGAVEDQTAGLPLDTDLGPGQCVAGPITFPLPPGATATRIQLLVGLHQVEWVLPGG